MTAPTSMEIMGLVTLKDRFESATYDPGNGMDLLKPDVAYRIAIEFAREEVKKALEAAAESAKINESTFIEKRDGTFSESKLIDSASSLLVHRYNPDGADSWTEYKIDQESITSYDYSKIS